MGTNPTNLLLLTIFLIFLTLTHFINYQTAAAAAASEIPSPSPSCNGSIAECNEEMEMVMESEISRRFLDEEIDEEKRYISYHALGKDQPVCPGAAGQPYSAGNCLPPPSNPDRRGCSPIYQCRPGA